MLERRHDYIFKTGRSVTTGLDHVQAPWQEFIDKNKGSCLEETSQSYKVTLEGSLIFYTDI
jgi:hypothetical protein